MKKRWSFQKGISSMFKIIGLIVIITLLVPIGYFAWRASQPMSMPEFSGLSYYEILSERRQAYDDLANKYQAEHPNVDIKFGMCFQSEVLMIAYNFPWAGYCSLAGVVPGLKSGLGSNAVRLGCGQSNGTWINLLGNWWNMFEHLTYDLLTHIKTGAVLYCRIQTQ